MKKGLCLLLAALLALSCAFAEEEWLYEEDAGTIEEESDWREDILAEAMEVYCWFTTSPLDVDVEITDDSGEYYLVLDERFATYDGMREILTAYFSDSIADSLLDNGMYQCLGDYLYTKGEAMMEESNALETEYVIAAETDGLVVYDMTVTYEGASEIVTYVLEDIDGEWRFTQFPGVY